MADFTELKNLIRVGTVQSVDSAKMTARVKFKDKNGMISGPLHILVKPRIIVPSNGTKEGNRTAATQLEYDQNDTLQTESHSHAAYITEWVPKVGSMVLCVFIPDGDGDGFILGGVK